MYLLSHLCEVQVINAMGVQKPYGELPAGLAETTSSQEPRGNLQRTDLRVTHHLPSSCRPELHFLAWGALYWVPVSLSSRASQFPLSSIIRNSDTRRRKAVPGLYLLLNPCCFLLTPPHVRAHRDIDHLSCSFCLKVLVWPLDYQTSSKNVLCFPEFKQSPVKGARLRLIFCFSLSRQPVGFCW